MPAAKHPRDSSGAGPSKRTPRKATLFDDLDAKPISRSADKAKALLKLESDDESSELSSIESEDAGPSTKRQKVEEDSDDEDIEFEDIDTNGPVIAPKESEPVGDLELTLTRDTRVSLTNPFGTKKGPTKLERGVRIDTHRMHVMVLMWHNSVRNGWLCNKDLQDILVKQLSKPMLQEVESWKRNSGLLPKEKTPTKVKGKGKEKAGQSRSQRDWGQPAERLESGQPNLSRGDPLFKLLKHLRIFWRSRFKITAPGLRKIGYMSLQRLDEEVKHFNNEPHDPELHGERIASLDDLKEHAKNMAGSRDIGAQLFTALLRGIGLETRMVANLQPLGFGWSQFEDALEKNPRKLKKEKAVKDSSDESSSDSEEEIVAKESTKKSKTVAAKKSANGKKPAKRAGRGSNIPVESEVSSSEESLVDVTPMKQPAQVSLLYDKDLLYPHYWTEVLSPITNQYTPVDALVLHIVANDEALLEKFEPRGAKSDKAKQVTSYIIGYSPDGTAKDVTTRYLKRHMWPGRTKGNRLPVEKVPIYNHKGKVKRYEEFDWFKTVMSGYSRGSKKCPRTEIDDHEDVTDLKPVKPEKKIVEDGKETLQSYKSSTEYVLERHFKREEALRPGAEHVKTFTIKQKGDQAIEEKVYLRKDVVSCKSMETWHKEGRAPILGEEPLKRVPYRVATTNRRRELAEAEHASGEKPLQGLFSFEQTDWIIPPPIEDGKIPKNNFGNIDLYVDSMLPEGAAHVPRRGTVKICKRLGIDYAEAVTGFEFGHRMAVPVITGVVIAEEHYEAVMEEWEKDEAERVRKEDEKRTVKAVGMWRKMLMGMRIIERVNDEYGNELDNDVDTMNPWINSGKNQKAADEAQARIMAQRDEEMAGGFFPEGHHEEDPDEHRESFFPVVHGGAEDGGFMVEDVAPPKSVQKSAYPTPQSFDINENPPVSDADGDVKIDDAKPDVPTSQTKKRGRPAVVKGKPSVTKTAKPTAAQKRKPAKKPSNNKSKRLEVEESSNEESELSEIESEEESESEVEVSKKPTKKAPARRASMPAKATTSRPTRRNAPRKSETKSKYFEHDSDDDNDE